MILNIGALSMSLKNGNRAARRNEWLIASMAAFRGCFSSGEIESQSAYSQERSWC